MKALLRKSRFDLGQAILLAFAAAVAWFVFVPWVGHEVRMLNDFLYRNRFARNTAELKASSAELAGTLSQLRKQISLFASSSVSMRGVEIVENIRTTAMETKVVLTGIESGGEKNKDGVVEYMVKAQARGSYEQIGSWTSKCLRDYPHLKIHSLSIKRSGIGSGPNLAQVEFVFCFPRGLGQ